MATILSLLTSLGFSYFVNNFGRYNEIYGSIGALIVIMIWLQINAFVILIGYELNASIAVNRKRLGVGTNSELAMDSSD
jgi:membrane protein